MITVKVRIYRYDPAQDREARYTTCTLEMERVPSVLGVLRHIYENADPSLAFRNYHCGRGVCASCLVMLNGRVVKGCETLLDPSRENLIEPLRGKRVIKDLVVETEEVPDSIEDSTEDA